MRGSRLLVLAAVAAGGCGGIANKDSGSTTVPSGSRTVDTAAVEQGIESDLSTQSVKVTNADCPSDVAVAAGDTFTCTVSMSNGGTGKVKVTQQGANQYTYAFQEGTVQIPGSSVDAQLEQQLAAQGAPNATVNCPQNIIVTVGTTVTCDVSGAQGVAGGTVTYVFSSANGTVDASSVT